MIGSYNPTELEIIVPSLINIESKKITNVNMKKKNYFRMEIYPLVL